MIAKRIIFFIVAIYGKFIAFNFNSKENGDDKKQECPENSGHLFMVKYFLFVVYLVIETVICEIFFLIVVFIVFILKTF